MSSLNLPDILTRSNTALYFSTNGIIPPITALIEAIINDSKLGEQLREINNRCTHKDFEKSVMEDKDDGRTLAEIIVRITGLQGLGFSTDIGWFMDDSDQYQPGSHTEEDVRKSAALTQSQEIRVHFALTKVAPIYHSVPRNESP